MKVKSLFLLAILSMSICSCENGEQEAPTCWVTWKNENGDILESTLWKEGETPEYRGPIPTKEGDKYYSYVFTGWQPSVTPVRYSNDYYTAVFERVNNKYDVYWKNGDEVLYSLLDVSYSDPRVYHGETPTKEPEIIENFYCEYTFSKWSSETIEGSNIIYNAEFKVIKTTLEEKQIIDHLKEKGSGEYHLVNTGAITWLGYVESLRKFVAAVAYESGDYSLNATYQCPYGNTNVDGTFSLKKSGLLIYECIVDVKTSDHLYSSASIREIKTNLCTSADTPNLNSMLVDSMQYSLNNCSNYLSTKSLPYIF